jgi:aspartyl-tRNA synthetase
MKICKNCQILKKVEDFYFTNKTKNDKRVANCICCHNKIVSERKRKQGEDWHKKENARKQKWADANRERYDRRLKNSQLKRCFGITLEQYEQMLLQQNNKCCICNKTPNTKLTHHKKPRRLAVDHCHKTGKIRGLLCFDCNSAIGKFQDSIQLLQNAIDYLKKN